MEIPGQVSPEIDTTRSDRPLLVIDGDSFAHRPYHSLPKAVRRSDGKAAGAWLCEFLIAPLSGRTAAPGHRRLV
jgi:5'-3' exonuclease